MNCSRTAWHRLSGRLLGGLILPGLVAVAEISHAEATDLPARAPVQVSTQTTQPEQLSTAKGLDLAACRALALEKQPAIAAAHASLAAAVARQQALENLCVPTFLQRDLPKRRQQASLGLTAAQAGVLQAEIDTIYAVQFAYVSYFYARVQDRLVSDILEQLDRLEKETTKAVADPAMRAKLQALRLLVSGRQAEAAVGADRALSTLREAVGVEEIQPAQSQVGLPDPSAKPDLQSVVQLALARRPEIIQASIGTEVADLEVCAQRSRLLALTVWTFAAGSDIHVNPLPTSSFGPNFRPGAVGPEMPVTINGMRRDRVEQAEIYHGRAVSVLEKTKNLIRLETEQAFYRWKEAGSKLAKFKDGVEQARKALPDLEKEGTVPRTPLALTSYLDTARLLTDLRLELNRARYDLLIALIALERVTAGGFCSGIETAPIAVEASVKAAENGSKVLEQNKKIVH